LHIIAFRIANGSKNRNSDNQTIDQLFQIEEQCFDQEAFSKRQIAYLLTDYNTIAFVAKANEVIAGFIIAQVEVEENTEFGHIITINVVPNFRRKGIGKRLLQEIETLLKKKGIEESRLEVREDNHSAIKLYQTFGYKTIGKLENYYGKKHGVYFQKTL
jgi:[ribosomal protein S18]-alanine N-acetyltransferase